MTKNQEKIPQPVLEQVFRIKLVSISTDALNLKSPK